MKSNLILLALVLFLTQSLAAQNWPSWRGLNHTGAIEQGNPPIKFSETENLKWKTAIPGKGHATPIIWENQIIVLTAVATDQKEVTKEEGEKEGEGMARRAMAPNSTDLIHEFKVISVNKKNGKIQWETTVTKETPAERTHKLGSWASNSATTDGTNIYAYFGSRGLYCLDFKGNVLWSRDFGQMEKVMSFGEGSTAEVYGDKVFIQWDHEGQSYIYALNKTTGEEMWTNQRDEGSSWATPLVVEVNGKLQVVTSATNHVVAYDFETGDTIWSTTGLTRNVIPNPMYANGILYVMSGYRGNAVMAIDIANAKGDITSSEAILWEYNQDAPYTPSPVILNGYLYFHRANQGVLTCLNAKTGEVVYSKEKIEGINDLYSSPTGVNNRLYIASTGVVVVIAAGEEFKVLATNNLDDDFHASPIFSGDKMILRGFSSLYCFE
jgi:outer membrane protein assembly factor BamB